jgi:hypothetical protein
MFTKTLSRSFLVIGLLVIILVGWCATMTSTASAQCDTPPKSSCVSCHTQEGHGELMGNWNKIHLSQDMCINCHGGNGTAMDKNLAHENLLAQPLGDIYTNCYSCHPKDYLAKSEQLAAFIQVTPASCATPTALAVINPSGEPPVGSSRTGLAGYHAQTGFWGPFGLLIGSLAAIIFFLVVLDWLDKHRVAG